MCDETKMIKYRNAYTLSRYLCKSFSPILQTSCTSMISNFPLCDVDSSMCQTRTIHLHKPNALSVPLTRSLTTTSTNASSDDNANKITTDGTTLTDVQAYDMIHQLSDAERAAVTKAINQYESNKIKSQFQGKKNVFNEFVNDAYIFTHIITNTSPPTSQLFHKQVFFNRQNVHWY